MSSTRDLITSGLVQFGLFADLSPKQHFRISLDILPSYPELIGKLAQDMATPLQGEAYDYLLATSDSVALATLVSAASGIPLVYQNGAKFDSLIGAYDVNHITCLICNYIWGEDPVLSRLVQRAEQVGLDVTRVLCVIEHNAKAPRDIPIRALYHWQDLVDEWKREGLFSSEFASLIVR